MNLLDLLPEDLLHIIASDGEPTYKSLLAYPRFARTVSPGARIDYMIGFGHDVKVTNFDKDTKNIIIWYRNGMMHRIDGPTVVISRPATKWEYTDVVQSPDGEKTYYLTTKKWFRDGKMHRANGPALKCIDRKEWRRDGKLHREDGPALIRKFGTEAWYRNGKLHRDDGPAIILANGHEYWYQNGVLQHPTQLNTEPTAVKTIAKSEAPSNYPLWLLSVGIFVASVLAAKRFADAGHF